MRLADRVNDAVIRLPMWYEMLQDVLRQSRRTAFATLRRNALVA